MVVVSKNCSEQNIITDEKWQAITTNDANYNGIFFYAVKTTRIFCKPSCKSRVPRKENVTIFKTAEEALNEGFRPCKRCKPTNEKLPESAWVSEIIRYINKNYRQKLTLEVLSEISHGSPFHLQRTFTKITGMSPTQYTQLVRVNKACQMLKRTDYTIMEIAERVGIPNTPYFTTTFKKVTGCTPTMYRQKQFTEGEIDEWEITKNNLLDKIVF